MEEELEEQEEDIWIKNLVPLQSLSNIEITKYFNNEPKFHGFSRNSLPRIKYSVDARNLAT